MTNVVVWEDNRGGQWNIYGMVLDGSEIAQCADKPVGDVTGDCRVDMADLAFLAADWLSCGLEPLSACL